MIVGIDLGTTNSLIAWLSPDGPQLIPNALGDFLTPSAVGIDHDGRLVVGKAAKELQVTSPDRCATCFKRLMGADQSVLMAKREFRAEELSSLVLKSLRADAVAMLKQPLDEAVITVPAYFSELQRKATIHAGELAGFNVRRIINEPTAAAIAYGQSRMNAERVALVVALGAAIQAGLVDLDKAVTDMVVTDVAPFTLGVEISKDVAGSVRGGYFSPVINRNTTIPVSRVEQFSTMSPNQQSVNMKLYQGDARRTEDNLFLGEFQLKGIPRGPAGQQVEIRFTYDLNGILEVEAVAPASGVKSTYVMTRHAKNMSESQLQAAIRKLQDLKTDPREDQGNRYLLKKADRIYREVSLDLKKLLESLIAGFEESLVLQDPSAIEMNKSALESLLSRLDEEL